MSATIGRRGLLRAGAGFALAGLGGCATAGTPGSGAFRWEVQPPESAGFTRAGLEGVHASIQTYIDRQELAGCVSAVARRGKLAWFEAQGVRDVESGAPMRRDDMFRMMSSTKHVTAVAVLMMVEEGRLAIDDPVSKYIPSFANPRVAIAPADWSKVASDPSKHAALAKDLKVVPADHEITIKHLLTHTSGLSSVYGLVPGPSMLVNQPVDITPKSTLADRIPRLGGLVLDFQPGARWGYSPLDGFDVLLHLVELVSGQSSEVFMRSRLFEPLGMSDTYFNVPAAKQHRVLRLVERRDGAWKPGVPLFGVEPTRYISGAGGLISTAHDMLNLELMLLDGGQFNGRRLLRPETVNLMSQNHVGDLFARWIPPITKGLGFGLGVSVVLDPAVATSGRGVGAFGWGGAYGTESWVDPGQGLAAVYLVQQPNREASRAFARAVSAAISA